MSILIRGVSMPKMPEKMEQGQEVPYVDVRVFADGDAVISTGVRPYYKKYQAIELPPHGRLIDADRLLEDYGLGVDCAKCKRDARSCQFEMIHTTMDFCEWIEDAPTIIPAERGADG